MPERQFSIPRATAFLRLVLIPVGMFRECSDEKGRQYAKNPKGGHREAWLKTMSEPCARHELTWGAFIVAELTRESLRQITHPNDDFFKTRKQGTPWSSDSVKARKAKGLIACRELGLDVAPFLAQCKDDSLHALQSRNWANSKAGHALVTYTNRLEREKAVKKKQEMSANEAIAWVAENINNPDVTIIDAPNGTCVGLYKWAQAEPDKFWAKFMDLSKTSKVKAGTDDDTPRDPAEASLDSILMSVGKDK
jgi:hypothetical protein